MISSTRNLPRLAIIVMTWDYDFPSGPYVRGYAIGGGGGSTFIQCEAGRGVLVKKIGVYYNSSCLQAIQVTYTDGTKATTAGKVNGSYGELIFEPGETAIRASLWGNGVGTRTGRILIKTTKGQTLDVGKNTSGQTEYSMDVGSGFVAGFAGRAAGEIDALSFVFLLPVKKVEMKDVKYTQPPPQTAIRPTNLTVTTYHCDSNKVGGLNWDFTNSVQRSNAYSFTSQTSQEFGMKVEVTAGIPEIASVTAGYEWKIGASQSQQWSNTETTTLSWSLSGHLEPGESCTCSATCQYGNADVEYSCNVKITFMNDGRVLQYAEKGVLHNAQYAFATATKSDTFTALEDLNNAIVPLSVRFPTYRPYYLVLILMQAKL